jgi:hypothetical protein
MDIRKVSQTQILQEPVRVKSDKEKEIKKHLNDSVELSPEALQRFQATETQKTDAITEKINSGFYFSKEVTEKVADEIIKRFTNS